MEWVKPHGGDEIKGYLLQWDGPNVDAPANLVHHYPGMIKFTFWKDGLVPGQYYVISILAFNKAGKSVFNHIRHQTSKLN